MASQGQSVLAFLFTIEGDAYVLHTRFFSMVTVGSYDSKDDPRIAHDQVELAKLNLRLASLPPDVNVDLRLIPQGVPIPVPRPRYACSVTGSAPAPFPLEESSWG